MPQNLDLDLSERKLAHLGWMVNWAGAFLLVFVVSMTALMLWQAYRLGGTASEVKIVAQQSHDSLCALKQDLQRRHDSTVQYLADHPDLTILGVPRQTFEKSVRDQQSTLDALHSLDCG